MFELHISHIRRLLRQVYGPSSMEFPSAVRLLKALQEVRALGEFRTELNVSFLEELILIHMALVDGGERRPPEIDLIYTALSDRVVQRVNLMTPVDSTFISFPKKVLISVLSEVATDLGLGPFRPVSRGARNLVFASDVMDCKDGLKQRVILDARNNGSPRISVQLAIGISDADAFSQSAGKFFLRGPWYPADVNQAASRERIMECIREPFLLASLSRDLD